MRPPSYGHDRKQEQDPPIPILHEQGSRMTDPPSGMPNTSGNGLDSAFMYKTASPAQCVKFANMGESLLRKSDSYSIIANEDRQFGQPKKQTTARKRKKRDDIEERKILLPRNRLRAIGHLLLFHAIPLAFALALIVTNMKTRYHGVAGK